MPERQSLLHNTFREPCSRWFRNCIWLHASLRFEGESLFWEFDSDFRARSSKYSVFLVHLLCSYSHTAPTADVRLVIHFFISLCEVLLIHTPCLLHNYTYLILFFIFVFIYEFSFLIMIVIVSIIYLNRHVSGTSFWNGPSKPKIIFFWEVDRLLNKMISKNQVSKRNIFTGKNAPTQCFCMLF